MTKSYNDGINERELRTKFAQKLGENTARWYNVRLGLYHDQEKSKFYSVLQHYADLIYIEKDAVWITEFKMRKQAEAVGQLLNYKGLFPQTIEFDFAKLFPIMLQLVTNQHKNEIMELCNKHGIMYVVM